MHEAIEKLPLLMEHYEVNDNYFSLALVLAMKYEPGFQIKQDSAQTEARHLGSRDPGRRTWPSYHMDAGAAR